MNITGNKFLADFGMAKAILHIHTETSLTFTILERNGNEEDISEMVKTQMTELRPNLYMITWVEKSGKTITQIHDYQNEIIYSNWTLPGGEFINKKGTLKQTDK